MLVELNMNHSPVTEVINYAKQFIGQPYGFWTVNQSMLEGVSPFYAQNKGLESLKVTELSCAGLINLMRRFRGLNVPGVTEKYLYAGGTYIWFHSLKSVLRPIDLTSQYKIVTLLIRNYQNEEDQGHVAVLIEDSSDLLSSQLIHAIPPQVQINVVKDSWDWCSEGYYSHYVRPEDWLFREI